MRPPSIHGRDCVQLEAGLSRVDRCCDNRSQTDLDFLYKHGFVFGAPNRALCGDLGGLAMQPRACLPQKGRFLEYSIFVRLQHSSGALSASTSISSCANPMAEPLFHPQSDEAPSRTPRTPKAVIQVILVSDVEWNVCFVNALSFTFSRGKAACTRACLRIPCDRPLLGAPRFEPCMTQSSN